MTHSRLIPQELIPSLVLFIATLQVTLGAMTLSRSPALSKDNPTRSFRLCFLHAYYILFPYSEGFLEEAGPEGSLGIEAAWRWLERGAVAWDDRAGVQVQTEPGSGTVWRIEAGVTPVLEGQVRARAPEALGRG